MMTRLRHPFGIVDRLFGLIVLLLLYWHVAIQYMRAIRLQEALVIAQQGLRIAQKDAIDQSDMRWADMMKRIDSLDRRLDRHLQKSGDNKR